MRGPTLYRYTVRLGWMQDTHGKLWWVERRTGPEWTLLSTVFPTEQEARDHLTKRLQKARTPERVIQVSWANTRYYRHFPDLEHAPSTEPKG